MKKTMILPIYNERKTMDAMLSQLEQIPEDVQVLFADGGSTDGTQARIPEKFTLLPCPKGRANQMNYAAGQAEGEVLWVCPLRQPPAERRLAADHPGGGSRKAMGLLYHCL